MLLVWLGPTGKEFTYLLRLLVLYDSRNIINFQKYDIPADSKINSTSKKKHELYSSVLMLHSKQKNGYLK